MEEDKVERRVTRGPAGGWNVMVRRAGQWELQCWHEKQGSAFACKRGEPHVPDKKIS